MSLSQLSFFFSMLLGLFLSKNKSALKLWRDLPLHAGRKPQLLSMVHKIPQHPLPTSNTSQAHVADYDMAWNRSVCLASFCEEFVSHTYTYTYICVLSHNAKRISFGGSQAKKPDGHWFRSQLYPLLCITQSQNVSPGPLPGSPTWSSCFHLDLLPMHLHMVASSEKPYPETLWWFPPLQECDPGFSV